MSNHTYYMQQVLQLARMTPRQTLPNPQVAAIVIKDQQIVGIGTHLFAGGPHAEIYALNQAGDKAAGATLYVNLEPCAHFGRTPPCIEAVIKAKIAKVYVANLDPNPLVSGKGVAALRAAGIDVETGLCADEAAEINRVFFHNMRKQMPYVTLKAGMSLDGRIATKENRSQWITNAESRIDAHLYRVNHQAILVGVNTVITDNPSLTPHMLTNPEAVPIRIVLDRNLRTPLDAKFINDGAAPTWIITSNPDAILHQQYIVRSVRVLQVAELAIKTVLTTLYQNGICSLLVEGGEQIYSSFIDSGYVDQLVCYYSPQLIGSTQAKHLFAGNGFADLQSNMKFKISEVKQLGNDVKIVSVREYKDGV